MYKFVHRGVGVNIPKVLKRRYCIAGNFMTAHVVIADM